MKITALKKPNNKNIFFLNGEDYIRLDQIGQIIVDDDEIEMFIYDINGKLFGSVGMCDLEDVYKFRDSIIKDIEDFFEKYVK